MTHNLLQRIQLLTTRVERWVNVTSKFMYSFKEGRFQIPYIPNEPDLMIEGFKKTPFVKFNKATQFLESSSPFLNAKQNYLNIEDGLWLIVTNIHWRVNVKVVAVVDDSPSDYFFVSYSRTSAPFNVYFNNGQHSFTNSNHYWTFHKSKTSLDAYFERDSKIFSVIFMFNKAWFTANILPLFNTTDVNYVSEIFHSNTAYKTYLYNSITIDERSNAIFNLINDKPVAKINVPEIQALVLRTITEFFQFINQEHTPASTNELIALKEFDRDRITKVEKILTETLTTGFLGLDNLATEAGISASKLKTDFKAVYSISIFQYYQNKQMELAAQMLYKKHTVAQIAAQLGYENVGKFSAKFKKTYGVVPSKYF